MCIVQYCYINLKIQPTIQILQRHRFKIPHKQVKQFEKRLLKTNGNQENKPKKNWNKNCICREHYHTLRFNSSVSWIKIKFSLYFVFVEKVKQKLHLHVQCSTSKTILLTAFWKKIYSKLLYKNEREKFKQKILRSAVHQFFQTQNSSCERQKWNYRIKLTQNCHKEVKWIAWRKVERNKVGDNHLRVCFEWIVP